MALRFQDEEPPARLVRKRNGISVMDAMPGQRANALESADQAAPRAQEEHGDPLTQS